jgi:tryptophan halogenase
MRDDPVQVDRIVVVGGGDAGLLTALALEKGLDGAEIVVVDDFEQSVPEVGKSTLFYFAYFLHEFLDIDRHRLITEVKLAWKTSVFFEDWCGLEPFHSPLGRSIPITGTGGDGTSGSRDRTAVSDYESEFHELYYRYERREFSTPYGEVAEQPGKAPIRINETGGSSVTQDLPNAAYHFNSLSLNEFLRTLCGERGVELVDDRIVDVTASDGWIERIAGDTDEYTADLYVDASGFRRVLVDELDNPLVEYDLPVDSAVVTTVDVPLSEIVSATVVTSGDAGWFWQIDTCDVRDLGYVYSSAHRSSADAKREFVESRAAEIDPDDIRQYRFDSGVLETPWLNNCVAAGNAQGFVEPLQSTALTTVGLLAERLAKLLGRHGRINHGGLRELFNTTTRATWDEVYDFISLYYKYAPGSTPFWEEARTINPGETEQHEAYQASGFAAPEIRANLTRTQTDLNEYYLYHLVLRNLGVDSEFYETLDFEVNPEVVARVEEYTDHLADRVEGYLGYEEFYGEFHPGFD